MKKEKAMINRRQFLAGSILAGAGLISTDAFCFERFFIEKNEFDIGRRGQPGRTVKMVQVSDLHLKGVSWYHESLVREINNSGADLILFTGDTVESNKGLPLFDALLALLDRRIRKLAVPGNWENARGVNLNDLGALLKQNNGELLINASETFTVQGKRLMITGIDDMLNGSADFMKAVKGIGREENHIVLSHCPQYRDDIISQMKRINSGRLEKERLNIQYVFSGHTHGGQVNLLGFAPFLPPGGGRYLKGWYRDSGPDMYVSRGVGTSILPVRFGSRAEIAVFNYNLG